MGQPGGLHTVQCIYMFISWDCIGHLAFVGFRTSISFALAVLS